MEPNRIKVVVIKRWPYLYIVDATNDTKNSERMWSITVTSSSAWACIHRPIGWPTINNLFIVLPHLHPQGSRGIFSSPRTRTIQARDNKSLFSSLYPSSSSLLLTINTSATQLLQASKQATITSLLLRFALQSEQKALLASSGRSVLALSEAWVCKSHIFVSRVALLYFHLMSMV